MIALRNVLLPTDFSDSALRATEYALELCDRFQATLHLLHVIEDPVIYLPMFESYPSPTREQFEIYARDRLENWVAADDRGTHQIKIHWLHGKPFVEIVRFAKDSGIDLIVMGTHGRGLVQHVLMGSVAEKVVRKASCPVLTVHPEGHQFVHP
jgi:nucleotide-binding universal stress UspA family protein